MVEAGSISECGSFGLAGTLSIITAGVGPISRSSSSAGGALFDFNLRAAASSFSRASASANCLACCASAFCLSIFARYSGRNVLKRNRRNWQFNPSIRAQKMHVN